MKPDLICVGQWQHQVTLLWKSTQAPKKCPACSHELEKFDGRKHKHTHKEG